MWITGNEIHAPKPEKQALVDKISVYGVHYAKKKEYIRKQHSYRRVQINRKRKEDRGGEK